MSARSVYKALERTQKTTDVGSDAVAFAFD